MTYEYSKIFDTTVGIDIDETKYTELIPEFENTYFKEVYDVLSSKYKLGRIRTMMKTHLLGNEHQWIIETHYEDKEEFDFHWDKKIFFIDKNKSTSIRMIIPLRYCFYHIA